MISTETKYDSKKEIYYLKAQIIYDSIFPLLKVFKQRLDALLSEMLKKQISCISRGLD